MERTDTTRGRWRGVFITVAMLLILYPFSVGPFAYLQVRGFLPDDVADSATNTLYRPLWKYSRSETLFARSYERYLQWWIQKALREELRQWWISRRLQEKQRGA